MKTAMAMYEGAWRIAEPLLKCAPRLSKGFRQRLLDPPPPPADLWIQAASVGEAYLAIRLIEALKPKKHTRVLITTGTDQGLAVLSSAIGSLSGASDRISVSCGYFPLDRPVIMEKAVACIRPKLVALMETEIWPGLLHALKKKGVPSLILNGRISPESVMGYRWLKSLWPELAVDRILAMSKDDALRFSMIFGKDRVGRMHNMKFDEMKPIDSDRWDTAFFSTLPAPFIVLGSIRKAEETAVARLLARLHERLPHAVIGLFPRHADRRIPWAGTLSRMKVHWHYRSALTAAPAPGTVLLWDTFGELRHAYAHADAVFVGGTLAPLGGQNFLEPLMAGVRPVIGPHWGHFKWVGDGLFSENLVRSTWDWRAAADMLIQDIKIGENRDAIRAKALSFLKKRQGGTRTAARCVESFL